MSDSAAGASTVPPIDCDEGVQAVREFFARLSANCAACDYDATAPLVADDVASFGTKAAVVVGLGPVRADQPLVPGTPPATHGRSTSG